MFLGLIFLVAEQKPHEYSSIQWVDLSLLKKSGVDLTVLKGWDRSDNKVELSKAYNKESKVLILSFFAEWCPNCHYEATKLRQLYSDYKSFGLSLVLIMNYSNKEKSLAFVRKYGLNMPQLFGDLDEKDEDKRNNTKFFQFRKILGDRREWGAPFYIIIEKEKSEKFGIVKGELIEKEIKTYITNALLAGSLVEK